MSDTTTNDRLQTQGGDRGTARSDELVTATGQTSVASGVVAKVARAAAGEVDGVEMASSSGIAGLLDRVRSSDSGGASADVASRRAALQLRLQVSWPRPVRAVTEETRHHVRARVQELTGYEVTDIDVIVEALPRPSRPRTARVR